MRKQGFPQERYDLERPSAFSPFLSVVWIHVDFLAFLSLGRAVALARSRDFLGFDRRETSSDNPAYTITMYKTAPNRPIATRT
jgi:hypothetical protein